MALLQAEVHNRFSIRRPTGVQRVNGRIAELELVAAVELAPPESAVREGDVSDPLAILRERSVLCRDAVEKGLELLNSRVVALELATPDTLHREYFPAFPVGDGIAVRDSSGRQLYRLPAHLMQQAAGLSRGPELILRFEDEIASIRGPQATARARLRVPPRKHLVQVRSVGVHLPKLVDP